MAVAFVQQAVATVATATTTVATITTTAGNCLIATISNASGATNPITSVTDTASNTWTLGVAGYQSGSNTRCEIWYCLSAASVTSVTVTRGTASNGSVNVSEWRGIVDIAAIDTTGTQGNATGTAAPGGSVTTTNPSDLIITGLSWAASVTASQNTGGFTALTGNASNQRLAAAYLLTASTGTYQQTWTLSGAGGTSGSATVAFKADPAIQFFGTTRPGRTWAKRFGRQTASPRWPTTVQDWLAYPSSQPNPFGYNWSGAMNVYVHGWNNGGVLASDPVKPFRIARANGISRLRTFVGDDASVSAINADASAGWAKLQTFFDDAAAYGMKIIISQYPTLQMLNLMTVTQYATWELAQAALVTPGNTLYIAYEAWLNDMLTHFASHPAAWSWEVMNEPNYMLGIDAGTVTIQQGVDFLDHMQGVLKAGGALNVNSGGKPWYNAVTMTDAQVIKLAANMDIMDDHVYPDNGADTTTFDVDFAALQARIARTFTLTGRQLPGMLGEIGTEPNSWLLHALTKANTAGYWALPWQFSADDANYPFDDVVHPEVIAAISRTATGPRFVKETTASVGSPATSTTITASATRGHLLVLFVARPGGTTGAPITGVTDSAAQTWTLAQTSKNGTTHDTYLECWYVNSAADITSVTVNSSTSDLFAYNLTEWSGSGPLFLANNTTSASGTSHVTQSVTTTDPGDLVISATQSVYSSTTTDVGSGFSDLTPWFNGVTGIGTASYLVAGEAGSYGAVTWTAAGAHSGSVMTLAFTPLPSPTDPVGITDAVSAVISSSAPARPVIIQFPAVIRASYW
jgi:hypothetical protein